MGGNERKSYATVMIIISHHVAGVSTPSVTSAQALISRPFSQNLPASSFASIPSHLNGTPMPREVRRFFYNEAAHAMMKALELGRQRMQIRQVPC